MTEIQRNVNEDRSTMTVKTLRHLPPTVDSMWTLAHVYDSIDKTNEGMRREITIWVYTKPPVEGVRLKPDHLSGQKIKEGSTNRGKIKIKDIGRKS